MHHPSLRRKQGTTTQHKTTRKTLLGAFLCPFGPGWSPTVGWVNAMQLPSATMSLLGAVLSSARMHELKCCQTLAAIGSHCSHVLDTDILKFYEGARSDTRALCSECPNGKKAQCLKCILCLALLSSLLFVCNVTYSSVFVSRVAATHYVTVR